MQEAELPDDPSIGDEELLWRRIMPRWVVSDGRGGMRPSSAAFQNYRDSEGHRHNAFSVSISSEAQESGVGPEEYVEGFPGYGVAAFPARLARSLDQRVARVPRADEPAHGHVIGAKPKSVQKAFSRGATIIIDPK